MGKDLYEAFPEVRELYDLANSHLEFDLLTVSFEGPEEKLKQTEITQPAIFVHSMAVVRMLEKKGIRPGIVAGHSLGEYSALVAAGVLDFETGLRLVAIRGRLMQHAGETYPGTMAAIIGLGAEKVEEICRQASESGVVVPANFNSPEQIVISGSVEGVRRGMELAREAGAKRVVELVVSGAFHSPLMEPALAELKQALETAEFKAPSCPVVCNATAAETTDPEELRQNLVKQLLSPVLWVRSIQRMAELGFQEFYETGPGKVLCGLVRRIDRSLRCIPVGTVTDFEKMG
jgi:[acyl-carrier-protein] S-malonyltransferase